MLDLPPLPQVPVTPILHVKEGKAAGTLMKRDDTWSYQTIDDKGVLMTVSGTKLYQAEAILAGRKAEGIVGYGGRYSNTAAAMAAAARAYDRVAVFHTSAGADTPEMIKAEKLGAVIHRHPAGYLSNVRARAHEYGRETGYPVGLTHSEAVLATAAQVQNVAEAFERKEFERIVIAVGLGVLLTGVLLGLRVFGASCPVRAVMVGGEPAYGFIRSYGPGLLARVTWERSDLAYGDRMPANIQGVLLDPVYEAKLVPGLRPGDLLWNSGSRT